jgi:hypothetical protein
MEKKKIDLRFYLLSSINVIPALVLGGGFNLDSLLLIGALIVLVINHTLLVKIVQEVIGASSEGHDSQRSLFRILGLMGLKMLLLFSLVMLIYLYKKELITKLFMIIFFQLIIQVLSIKNNYLKS